MSISAFPGSPRVLKGGLVLLDPEGRVIQRVIPLQYNPDTLTRSLQVLGSGPESGDRLESLRLKGPPVETIKLEAEIDATDQLEDPDNNADAVNLGIHPQLAALETVVYPASADLQQQNSLAGLGTLEIAPVEAPLTLFVWSRNRVVPVRITEFSITEEAFDPALNPIRAKISLTLRVMSINDLDFPTKAASLYLVYQQQKEQLARRGAGTSTAPFGIGGLT
jgi:hypothetical protein